MRQFKVPRNAASLGRFAVFAVLAVVLLGMVLIAQPSGGAGFQIVTVGVTDTAETKGSPAEAKGGPSRPAGVRPGYGGDLLSPGQGFIREVEPNNTSATATPLGGTNVVLLGNIFPNGDVDYFSFTAAAGDRVYAAVMTSASANASSDSQLDVLDVDGTTSLEFDDDNGVFGGLSSAIAGTTIPAAGTYYLRVKHFSATNQLRPYHLHFQLQSGSPVAESEPNDSLPGQPLPAGGWVSGATSSTADVDLYTISLNAGDTVSILLDLDPERDTVEWNGQLGLGLFNGFFLTANDAGAAGPDAEAYFMTVKSAGTYSILVNVPTGGTTFGTYHLSVSVLPATPATANCTTYTSTDVPQTIPTGPGIVSSTITVPGNPRIADLDVAIQLTHANMPDLDVHLRSPAGNDNGLFSDVGSNTQMPMDLVLDDEAGIPIGLFTVMSGMAYMPELAYRLSWFDGEDAGGTWTLDLRDDTAASGGTLTGWSLTICEPPPPPACPAGAVLEVVFNTDFESGAAGFTHSGTADEWELGLPTFAPLTTCNSGSSCWATDLDNTYNASSIQDLLSPNINLAGLVAPVTVTWAQRYQIESASFDHLSVDFQEAGGANPTRLFEWLDATMTDTVGGPTVTLNESSGWSQLSADASAYAGLNTELRFHLDSDTTVQLAGLAIDDVSVTACRVLMADLAITKTDGVASATPGGSVTYTITASNAGPDGVTGASVSDTFPASLTCSWTCVGAGGGTCTAGPVAGNIADSVNLPAGGSVTYTASCTLAAGATGSLVNTATVSSAIADPNSANNSATDTDMLTPSADLAITKTDGVTSAQPGQMVTYTVTASNAGPSDVPSATVADTFPASLTCSWTCAGAGGGTCTAGPTAGNIADGVSLPAGGSVTYTAACTIAAGATGTLSNTATVSSGVTDPNPGNNSATDSDTLAPTADLSITKTDGLTNAQPGQAITYTVVASNAGPSNAPGSTVADTFPAALTGVSWTCVGAGGGTCTAGPAGGNIADSVNLPAGGSVTYTVNATIDGAFTGTLSNTATVATGTGVTDPTPGNNSATDQTMVSAGAMVTGAKTIAGTFTVGGTVTYTVVLTNSGDQPQPDNPGDEFEDILPSELTLVSANATSGTALATVATNTVTWNGTLAAGGGTVTITIQATINGTAVPGTTVTNQGTIFFDGDGNGSNESSTTTDDPALGGPDDPTVFSVQEGEPQVEIPTLTTVGFAALALLLATVALAVLRRQRRAG